MRVLSRQAPSCEVKGIVVELATEKDSPKNVADGRLSVSSEAEVDGVKFSYWMHTKNKKSLEAACQSVRNRIKDLQRKSGNAEVGVVVECYQRGVPRADIGIVIC